MGWDMVTADETTCGRRMDPLKQEGRQKADVMLGQEEGMDQHEGSDLDRA